MRRLGWLLVPIAAVLVWWLVRGGDPTTQSGHASRAPTATAPGDPVAMSPRTTTASPAPARPDPAISPTAPATAAGPAPIAQPGVPPPRSPTPGSPTAQPSLPPAPAAGSGVAGSGAESSSGGLTDKTGWDDSSAVKQLNKELMPLVSECIDQARARNPRLHGLLALAMNVAPTENHKIIVSVKPGPGNQVEDAELFECIRESSFSIEGLKAPHDFGVTIPIDAGSGSG